MKMFAKILAIAIMVASCSAPADVEKPEGGSIVTDPTEINVDFEEQDIYVTVNAESDW